MINGHFQLKNFSWKALWSSNHSLVTPPGNDMRRNLHIPVIFSLIKRTTLTPVLVFYLFVSSMLDISSEPSTHYRAGHGTADSHQKIINCSWSGLEVEVEVVMEVLEAIMLVTQQANSQVTTESEKIFTDEAIAQDCED